MTPLNSNSACIEVSWEQPRAYAPLMGEFTLGVSTKTVNRISELGVFSLEPTVSTQVVIASEISSFSPESYILKCSPMRIEIVGQGSEYIASQHESNIHSSGDTPYEAIENLKSLILDTFDSLTAEPLENLGGKAKCQRALLESLIERQ
jgi:predicted RNase H-like HicB family nuclease